MLPHHPIPFESAGGAELRELPPLHKLLLPNELLEVEDLLHHFGFSFVLLFLFDGLDRVAADANGVLPVFGRAFLVQFLSYFVLLLESFCNFSALSYLSECFDLLPFVEVEFHGKSLCLVFECGQRPELSLRFAELLPHFLLHDLLCLVNKVHLLLVKMVKPDLFLLLTALSSFRVNRGHRELIVLESLVSHHGCTITITIAIILRLLFNNGTFISTSDC